MKIKKETRPLPDGWKWKRLSDVVIAIENGGRPKGGVAGITEGVLSIGAEHISEQQALYLVNPRYVPPAFYSQMTRGIVQPSDVLLVKDGATTGRVAFVEKVEEPGMAINEHVFILRSNQSEITPRYLYFALCSPSGQQAILKSFRGSAQGGITQEFAESVWIPAPTMLGEQEFTEEKIKGKLAEAQRLRLVSEKQFDAAKRLPINVVNQAMVRFGNPSGRLIDILSTPPASGWPFAYGNESAGTPFLTLSAVLNFEYDGKQVKFTDRSLDENSEYWARLGDIFISRSNTPELVGQAAIYDGTPERVVYPDLLIRLQTNTSKADVKFVHYWLMASVARRYITDNARGSSGTMKKITLEMVEAIPFPSQVSRDEQEAIALEIERKVMKAKQIYVSARKQTEAINALPNAILQETFGGFEPPAS